MQRVCVEVCACDEYDAVRVYFTFASVHGKGIRRVCVYTRPVYVVASAHACVREFVHVLAYPYVAVQAPLCF